MVQAGANPLLAEVKAVEPGYPLRGEILLEDADQPAGRATRDFPQPGTVWIDQRLRSRLGVNMGERVQVGDSALTVSAIVQQEPEVSGGFLGLSPKLLMTMADLARDESVAAGQSRRVPAADSGRGQRSVPDVAAAQAGGGAAHRNHTRPAARGALDARARGKIPRALGAGGRAARSRRRGAGLAPLSAAATRCRGRDALPGRFAGQGAGALCAAIRLAGAGGESRRVRRGAGRTASAGDAAAVAVQDRVAVAGPGSGVRRVHHRHPPVVRFCAAAVDCALERAAAARVAPRSGRAQCLGRAGLRAGHRGGRRADFLAGGRQQDRPDHAGRRRRAARGSARRGVAAAPCDSENSAARLQLALWSGQSAPAAAGVVPANRRAGPGADGAAPPFGRARGFAADLAIEPAGRFPEQVPDQYPARADRAAGCVPARTRHQGDTRSAR